MSKSLPFWAWPSAWALACAAGIVNVVGVLSFQHQAVTHLTGTTSLLAIAIVNSNRPSIWHLVAVIGSFIAGAAVSGAIIKDSTLKLGRRYGLVLVLESILLVVAVPLLDHRLALGTYVTGAACGLQNAMVSTYSGTVLRTSHVTGMFTDLGIFIGQVLTRTPIEKRRFSVSLVVISAFLVGGIAGTMLFNTIANATLYIPAAITGMLALMYAVYRVVSLAKLRKLAEQSH